MKYVVFKHKNLLMPVIIPDCVTHSQIKIEDAEPISAGFFRIGQLGQPIVSEKGSDSLNLLPDKERDEKLLRATIDDYGTNSFIDWGDADQKELQKLPTTEEEFNNHPAVIWWINLSENEKLSFLIECEIDCFDDDVEFPDVIKMYAVKLSKDNARNRRS